MLEEFKTALDKAETKADVAVVLGAGTVGFAVDAMLNVVGLLSPGTVGALSAGGALSLKKAWDAYRDARRERAAPFVQSRDVRMRAAKLAEYMGHEEYPQGESLLRRMVLWHEMGIISDEQLDDAITDAIRGFLVWSGNFGNTA